MQESSGRACSLNATAHFIWRHCDGTRTVGDIQRLVARAFAGSAAHDVPAQVADALTALLSAGCLEEGEPQAPGDAKVPAPRPQQVTLHVTPRCNLACRHCYKSPASESPRSAAVPPLAEVRGWIDQAAGAGARHIVLTGGEILTREDWREVVAYAGERLPTGLLTNGILIDEAAADFLAASGVAVQISVDGASADTHDAIRGRGAFAGAMAGVHRLLVRGVGPRLAWSVCLGRHNAGTIEVLLKLAMDLGVGQVYLLWATRRGAAARHWQELALGPEDAAELAGRLGPWLRKFPGRIRLAGCDHMVGGNGDPDGAPPCPLATGETALVDVDGSIYPCILLAAPEFRLGSMSVEGLAGALASDTHRRLQQMVAQRAESLPACAACDRRSACRGACPGLAWVETGEWWRTDGLCRARGVLWAQADATPASDAGVSSRCSA